MPIIALRIDGAPGNLTCRTAPATITLSRWRQDCDLGVDFDCATALGFAQGSREIPNKIKAVRSSNGRLKQ
ncbi:MAG: hypothetical protein ACREEP_01660 [Dongiaceae bacterium]